MIFRVIALLYLGVNAATDIRRREIDIRITVAFGIVLASLQLSGFSQGWNFTFLNVLPFAVLLAANRIFAGAVGVGDAWVAGMLGLLLPGAELMRCMVWGFWLAGIWGLIQRVQNKKRKEIPLIPFVLLSYVMGYCL